MKQINPFLLLLSLFLLSNCNPDDDSSSANIYENCCNMPPLEEDFNPGKLYIPNIFTPDGNGINDLFFIFGDDGIEEIVEFKIIEEDGTVVFEVLNTPVNGGTTWSGTTNTGTSAKGLFNYSVIVRNTAGNLFEINGKVCSYDCGEVFPNDNLSNCGFGVQHSGEGEFDPNLPAMEDDCF